MNDLAWKFPRFKIVYDKYVKTIPKDQRRPDMPRTPDIHQPNYVNSKEFSNQARNRQPILPDSAADLGLEFLTLLLMVEFDVYICFTNSIYYQSAKIPY